MKSWKHAVVYVLGVGCLTVAGALLVGAVLRAYSGLPGDTEIQPEPPDCFIAKRAYTSVYESNIKDVGGTPWVCDAYRGHAFCEKMLPSVLGCADFANSQAVSKQKQVAEVDKAVKEQEERESEERKFRRHAMWDILYTIEEVREGKIDLKEAKEKL